MAFAACSDSDKVEIPDSATVEVSWDGLTINQEESPEWCLARSNKWIALSNYDEKTQYYLSWDGGYTSGAKENAVLQVSLNGGAPEEYLLSSMNVANDGVNCVITFSNSNGATGKFEFPLETL